MTIVKGALLAFVICLVSMHFPTCCFAKTPEHGLIEAIMKGVEQRERAVQKIHSIKAVWQGEKFRDQTHVLLRELMLLEGEKQRIETSETNRSDGKVARQIIVSDGVEAWDFQPTEKGLNRGPSQILFKPGCINSNPAVWMGIEWRFESKPHSAMMREGKQRVEVLTKPHTRYKLIVKNEAGREKSESIWWVAPELGYAITSWQLEYFGDHPRRLVVEYDDFRKVADGIWLPHYYKRALLKPKAGNGWVRLDQISARARSIKVNVSIPQASFAVPPQ